MSKFRVYIHECPGTFVDYEAQTPEQAGMIFDWDLNGLVIDEHTGMKAWTVEKIEEI